MGARRAGYFAGVIVMVLGIIMVPVGMIAMAGGIFDSIQTGSGDVLALGIALLVGGIIMFVVGLVAALILKKSSSDNVNITISAHDSVIGVSKPNPLLDTEVKGQDLLDSIQPESRLPDKTLSTDSSKRTTDVDGTPSLEQYPDPPTGQAADAHREPEDDLEEISLRDMVADLQEAEMGDAGRLNYVAKRLADGRTIYDSDKEYVKKQFSILRTRITSKDHAGTDLN